MEGEAIKPIFKDPIFYLGVAFCTYLYLQACNSGLAMRYWVERDAFVAIGVDMRKPFAFNEDEAITTWLMSICCLAAMMFGQMFSMTRVLAVLLGVMCIVCGIMYDYVNTGAALIFMGGCLCLSGVK